MMSLSLPAIVGMAVIGLYTFMDAVYAGQLIGMEAMESRSRGLPVHVHQFRRRFDDRHGVGLGAVTRHRREKTSAAVDQVMGNLVVMNLVLSLTVTIVGTVFARPLLALTGAQGQVLDLAESYLRIMLVGSLFVNFAQSSNMVMRGKGELARAMAIMGGGRRPQHGAGPSVHPGPTRPRARHPGGGLRHGDRADDPSGRHAVVVRQAREDGAHRPRGRFARDTPRSAEGGRVHAMLMQVLVLVQQAIAYRAAAAWGGAEWRVAARELRCASRRSPSSLCGA